jgi:GNAT superfamily N-acetyltransferase
MKSGFIGYRIRRFYGKYGFSKSIGKFFTTLRDLVIDKPDFIYFADLPLLKSPQTQLREACYVVERRDEGSLLSSELEALNGYIGSRLISFRLKERFSKGASLWLLKTKDECIGMVWTIVGATIEPYYYFIGRHDVHFFNNEVFIPYRGKGFNPGLIEHILFSLKERGALRAYLETNQRNIKEQRSIQKTSFQKMGLAKKKKYMGKRHTIWTT